MLEDPRSLPADMRAETDERKISSFFYTSLLEIPTELQQACNNPRRLLAEIQAERGERYIHIYIYTYIYPPAPSWGTRL